MQNIKQNLLLVLAILLPIIFIGVLYLVSKIPTTPIVPTQNVLYSITNYGINSKFSVNYIIEDGKLVRKVYDNMSPDKETSYVPVAGEPRLYEYDFKTNSVIPLTFEEAEKKSYSLKYESDEGYTISQEYSNGGIFYSGPSYPTVYIYSKNNRSKLNIELNPSRNEGFQFIGWINK